MKRILVLVSILALSLIASETLLAQQESPWVGTWKLNVAKSNFMGAQPIKSQTRTEVAQGDGFTVTYEGIAADGSPISYGYTTNLDGKDSPYSGREPNGADTVAVTRVDANTRTAIQKKAGKTLYTTRGVVSKDGKVLTITSKGINAQGQPISVMRVWDKQ
jgi:hypothetical protein